VKIITLTLLLFILPPAVIWAQDLMIYRPDRGGISMWEVCDKLRAMENKKLTDQELFEITNEVFISFSSAYKSDSMYRLEKFYKMKNDLFKHCNEFKAIAMETYNITEEIYTTHRQIEKGFMSASQIPLLEDRKAIVNAMKTLKEFHHTMFCDIADLSKSKSKVLVRYFYYAPDMPREIVDVKDDLYLVLEISYDIDNHLLSNCVLNTDTYTFRKMIEMKASPPGPPAPEVKN